MRRFILAVLAMLCSAPAFAQSQSATVQVSAVVPKVCRFVTTSANLSIGHNGGEIDPLSGAQATGATTLDFFCGVGVSVEFSTPESPDWAPGKVGTPTLTRVGGTETMSANVAINPLMDAPVGQGYSVPLQVAVTGLIDTPSFSSAPAGTYAGTQTFNIRGTP